MPLAVALCCQLSAVSSYMKCALVLSDDAFLFPSQRLNKVTDGLYRLNSPSVVVSSSLREEHHLHKCDDDDCSCSSTCCVYLLFHYQ